MKTLSGVGGRGAVGLSRTRPISLLTLKVQNDWVSC